MLNYRFLYSLLEASSVQTFLAIIAGLGFGVLLDIIVILKLSIILGPWIVITIITAGSAIGVLIMYNTIGKKKDELLDSVNNGIFTEKLFNRYVTYLVISGFIVVPGIINKIFGGIMALPKISDCIGKKTASAAGIDWNEAYEHLRLNSFVEK